MQLPAWTLGAILAILTSASAAPARFVWWEGEGASEVDGGDRARATVPVDARAVFSGSDALTLSGSDGAAAEYTVEVKEAGEWFFYLRKQMDATPFRWRFDEGPWHYVLRFRFRGARLPSRFLELDRDWNDAEQRITDSVYLDSVAVPGGADIGWMALGVVRLGAGSHRLRIEAERAPLCLLDAFLLHRGHFTPRGKLRPSDSLPREAGWWAFCPEPDLPGGGDVMINLRDLLNEPYAGSRGPITARGESFTHSGTGEPVRFWATNVQPCEVPAAIVEEMADFLALRGINLVRIFPFHWKNNGAESLENDPVKIRRFQRVVEIFKRRGIYTMIALYSGRCVYDLHEVPGFEAWKPGQNPWLLHLFHPAFKAAYRNWLSGLLTAENPFGGVPLAEDPAVLGIELQNEANTLWYAFQAKKYPPDVWAMVENLYQDWLVERHGSVEAAWEAWEEAPGSEANGAERLLQDTHRLVSRSRRSADQVRFCTELERNFNEEAKAFLKKEIGFRGLILASNWGTAQNDILYPALTWAENPQDFSDHHHYFHAPRRPGTPDSKAPVRFADRSGLRWEGTKPGQEIICCGFLDVIRNGKPVMCSEYSWRGRNRWRPEYPLFVAAQSRGAGMDAMVEFRVGPVPGWVGSEVRWVNQVPAVLGQFPAAALLFRTDVLREGRSLVRMRITEDEARGLRAGQLVTKEGGVDLNRAFNGGAATTEERLAVENRGIYFSAGKVNLDVGPFPSRNEIAPLDPWWDRENRIIHHSNGQISWDYGKGIYTIDAPAVQAAVGFLGRVKRTTLSSLEVETAMPFLNVCLVALDERPLAESKRMLLQVMPEQKQFGERFSEPDADGFYEVLLEGGPPVMLRDIEATMRFLWAGAERCRITPLRPNFSAAGEPVVGSSLRLTRDILYYLIEP